MSLSIALSSALSGLNLTARATQLVSDNIANAQTEGYGVRSLSQAARVTGMQGSGVVATGIRRESDPVLLADLRQAHSEKSQVDVMSGFWTGIEAVFGMPDEPGGLTFLLDALGVSLQNAVTQPESDARLQNVALAASEIARRLGSVHEALQSQRDIADSAIAKDVATLNQSLQAIADLNNKIHKQTLLGGAPESLIDARQRLVDDVANIVSVREIPRQDGRIMLMGADGSILVDRTAAQFEFSRTRVPDATDLVENGALSQVTLNGRNLEPGNALLATGQLGAFLEIRDKSAPRVQQHLDMLANDLIARFGQPALDPSLPAAAFGLFALDGTTEVPADTTGIAGRIILNPLADADKGGELWRIRNGMGLITAPTGMVSDNALLSRMLQVLSAPLPLPGSTGVARSAAIHASDTLSLIASERLALDQRGAMHTARAAMLQEAFAARGVDTDAEMGKLLVLEQAYAANARVIATVDAMWRSILEIA